MEPFARARRAIRKILEHPLASSSQTGSLFLGPFLAKRRKMPLETYGETNTGCPKRPIGEGDTRSAMKHTFPEGDISFIVIVVLICVELLKVLIAPNPFDVILLGGLILVLILTARP